MKPNQFMHQKRHLDGVGRPSNTIQMVFPMHKLIRIWAVSGYTLAQSFLWCTF